LSNPRTHSRKQIRQIANSIRRFGFTNPVLISDDGEIIAGHERVEAATPSATSWPNLNCSDVELHGKGRPWEVGNRRRQLLGVAPALLASLEEQYVQHPAPSGG
jgi:hypothetical protein